MTGLMINNVPVAIRELIWKHCNFYSGHGLQGFRKTIRAQGTITIFFIINLVQFFVDGALI